MKLFLSILVFIVALPINRCMAQEGSNIPSDLNGKWLIEFNSNDIGSVKTIFNFKKEGKTFSAFTRKGADRSILGFWKSTFARTFTNDFKNGSLVRITDGTLKYKNDTVYLAAIFRSSIGSYYFNGTIVNDTLKAILRNSKKGYKGELKGYKDSTIEYPLNNYSEIIAEAIDTTKTKIFNKDILQSKEWKQFETKIKKKSKDFKDDIELVFAFYYFANKLPISHFALIRVSEINNKKVNSKPLNHLKITELSDSTVLLKIHSFSGSKNEVDSIFSIIDKKDYANLIVDLRNNPGGSVEAGMAFAKNVIDTTLIGGIFLTQKWFNNHNYIPKTTEYNQFPIFSEANFDLIIEGIHREKGLVLKVEPKKQNYHGKLYIITNKNTASTCEPIVYALKKSERATIVGEKTAGAMLNGEQFKLPSSFSVFVPTADYYTIDGYKIDQKGVLPNIKIKKDDPVEYIKNNLLD